jgi:aldehyde dehydrogenase (NAD+)
MANISKDLEMSTVIDQIDAAFELQKSHKIAMKNTSIAYRIGKLKEIKREIVNQKQAICEAIHKDFHKPAVEVELTEVMPVISMINLAESKLSSWAADHKIKTPLLFKGSKSWVRYEGKGNVLVISPWNYPFQLNLYPILTSFMAGNTTICKPSEFTPHTNKIIVDICAKVFTPEEVQFFEGEVDVSTKLLDLPFDHIFFTGSTNVGKVVMAAAAKHLASVGLELGGKSPAVLDKGCDIGSAAKKIAWGKLVNGGQTCVAPDYLLVNKEEEAAVVDALITHINVFYEGNDWKSAKDYNHIITKRHAQRLNDLIQDAVEKGAKIAFGGEFHAEEKVLSPTILTGVTKEMKVMQEEIFGPILPVVAKETLKEKVEFINSYDNALAMYVFSESQDNINYCMDNTYNGGVTVNDCLIAVGHPMLPFGGAGKSGIGRYHGKYGFEEFSNLRPVMRRDLDLGTSYFFPPYTEKKTKIVKNLLDKFNGLF